jgi:hypothetical protein
MDSRDPGGQIRPPFSCSSSRRIIRNRRCAIDGTQATTTRRTDRRDAASKAIHGGRAGRPRTFSRKTGSRREHGAGGVFAFAQYIVNNYADPVLASRNSFKALCRATFAV